LGPFRTLLTRSWTGPLWLAPLNRLPLTF
jgi:hypothetical protein